MSVSVRHIRRKASRRNAGFTLMEVLVVMTIMGLMMPLIYANVRAGVTAWVQGQVHVSSVSKVQNIQMRLRKQLSQAYPKYLASPGVPGHVEFEGQARSLQFISPMPEALGSGGWAKTTLSILPDDKGVQLTLSQRPELAWEDAPDAPPDRLIGDLKSASFTYFGSDNVWHDDWSNQKELPRLIKLQAEFADGKGVWPDLVVMPQIAADAGCIYDPLTKFCRGR